MDALVIGPPHSLADAIARRLRRHGRTVLRALPADASDWRVAWLLDEAGRAELIVVVDSAPFAVVHGLLAHTRAHVVLAAERPAPVGVVRPLLSAARGGRAHGRSARPRRAALVPAGPRRREMLSAEQAAAIVLRSCDAAAASCR